MQRYLLIPTMALVVFAIGGCASFSMVGDSTRYDPAVRSAEGSVIVSDPKLYSREALIDERSKEIARIDDLIKKADTIEFKPDIVREIEQIRAISAALGLKFDPAAGVNYRRAEETGDLQQEINTLRLQLQLDQLRRDAELLRARLPNQTDPLNTDLGVVDAEPPTPLASESATMAIAQLKAQVDRLTSLLQSMSGNSIPALNATTVSSNPFDDFRDKQAYLDMLRSARNAAALDELHDLDAVLIRLNFQATVIPDSKYPKSLAAVQIKVSGPSPGQEKSDKTDFLLKWLGHINRNANKNDDGRPFNDNLLADLERRKFLTNIMIRGRKIGFPSTLPSEIGQVPQNILSDKSTLQELIDAAKWGNNINYQSINFMAPGGTAGRQKAFEVLCRRETRPGELQDDQSRNAHALLSEDLKIASARIVTYEYAEMIDSWLKADGNSEGFATTRTIALQEAKYLIRSMQKSTSDIPDCVIFSGNLPVNVPKIEWGPLMAEFESASKMAEVRIYEVGPREQVQQVSTSARSAESLALAASIAASAPSSGLAGEAALDYSRLASRRATARERVPSVVGYSIAGKNTFGWVLGPRVAIDPKGSAIVEHMLKPYDLSVDMSIPAWWTKLNLELITQWGPLPSDLVAGDAKNKKVRNKIAVPLSRKSPDYEWFTQRLIRPQSEDQSISDVTGGPVNACFPSTLFIRGRNIWRAEKVMLLGQILGRERITVAPDMQGILLSVPPIVSPTGDASKPQKLFVFTPKQTPDYTGYIAYLPSPSGEACAPKKDRADQNESRPIISKTNPDPLRFSVPAGLEIRIEGKNLRNITAVWLHDKKGKLELAIQEASKKETMTITFSEEQTKSFPESDAVKLEFIGKVGDSEVLLETKSVAIKR